MENVSCASSTFRWPEEGNLASAMCLLVLRYVTGVTRDIRISHVEDALNPEYRCITIRYFVVAAVTEHRIETIGINGANVKALLTRMIENNGVE